MPLFRQNIFLKNVLSGVVVCDTPEAFQVDFQDPASSLQEGITYLYDDLMFFLCFVFGFVFAMLFVIAYAFQDSRYLCSGPADAAVRFDTTPRSPFYYPAMSFHTLLEFGWTVVPSFILVTLILPTFSLIYSLDDLFDAQLTLKVIGHQWYWSYEYGDLLNGENYQFDSYMLLEDDLRRGMFRLLEVDNRVILPKKVHIRLMVTSTDVLHSWAVPSLGVKMDACPGRLNQVALFITRKGIFYGQCSEICGVNHAFMPICVESI